MRTLYCTTCPSCCQLKVIGSGFEMIVEGNKCEKGREFADTETENPARTLTTTVRTRFPGIQVLPVRTTGEIPKDRIYEAMRELSEVSIDQEMDCGDIVLADLAETGVSVILTSGALTQLGAELENKNVELERRAVPSGPSASASPVDSSSEDQGIGIVRNAGALDDMGVESADGFVGAAGEAVGVETEDEEEPENEEAESGEGRIKQKSRPHIKRR